MSTRTAFTSGKRAELGLDLEHEHEHEHEHDRGHDAAALVTEAREHIEHIAKGVRRGENDDPRTSLLVRLADAVEALQTENGEMATELHYERTGDCQSCRGTGVIDSAEHRCGACNGRGYIKLPIEVERDTLKAENEKLRQQLDAMTTTVEYAYGSLDAPDTITPTGEDIDDLGSARYNAEEFWISVLQRTVMRGPWVEVTD